MLPIQRFFWNLGWKRFHIAQAENAHLQAHIGFSFLGARGDSATPRLIQIVNTGTDEVKSWALACLIHIHGKDGTVKLLAGLLKDPNEGIAVNAGTILVRYDPNEAKQAGVYKKFPQLIPPTTTSSNAVGLRK